MSIIDRALRDKKGLRTDMESVTLVASQSMKACSFNAVQFACAHGVGSSRVMAGHVALAALMSLARTRSPWGLPEVAKLLKTLASMKALVVVQTVKQRAAAAMRAPIIVYSIAESATLQ